MKRLLPLICIIMMLPVHAMANGPDLPHIAVFGSGEKMVAPDRMAWSLKVVNKGTSLKAVAADHNTLVGDLLTFLKKSKIEEDSIQTSRMQFGENWEYRKGTRVREGYFASTDVSFKLTALDDYNRLWMSLAEMAHVSLHRTRYELTDKNRHQDEVRKSALLSAKEKAASMAEILNVEIGEPLVIQEDWQGFKPVRESGMALKSMAAMDAPAVGSQNALAPGKIPVRARVKLTFRIIDMSN